MAECATDHRAVLTCDTRSRAGEAVRLVAKQRIRCSRFLLEIAQHDGGDVLEISQNRRTALPKKAGLSPAR